MTVTLIANVAVAWPFTSSSFKKQYEGWWRAFRVSRPSSNRARAFLARNGRQSDNRWTRQVTVLQSRNGLRDHWSTNWRDVIG